MKFLTRSSYTAFRLSLGILGVLLCAWLLASLIDLSWVNHTAESKPQSVSDPSVSDSHSLATSATTAEKKRETGWRAVVRHPLARVLAFTGMLTFLLSQFYFRGMLDSLDAATLIPQSTVDSLAEGLVIIDQDELILLANQSFVEIVNSSVSGVTGKRLSDYGWSLLPPTNGQSCYPWIRAARDRSRHLDQIVSIGTGVQKRLFRVRATPMLNRGRKSRNIFATFEDVTHEQHKNEELKNTLQRLAQSRDAIRCQNLELEHLAATDPLTSCMNRRAFFPQIEKQWAESRNRGKSLSLIMIDLDRFKAINDLHGHAAGDQVLAQVANLLRMSSRKTDSVCRYGGEEFCILLPGTSLEPAKQRAEQLRQEIEQANFDVSCPVHVSMGVTSVAENAGSLQELMEQADQALLHAKRNGRNQVVCWRDLENLPNKIVVACEQLMIKDRVLMEHGRCNPSDEQTHISIQAVTALGAALWYRDSATAEHSRRVADLCAKMARDLLSFHESFILESAALLHDTGKLCVPDSILLKPRSLSKEEWSVLRKFDNIGVEIVKNTFRNNLLVEIVQSYHAWYGGTPHDPQQPVGENIPLEARILALTDAYDAMTSDKVYRKGRTTQEAIQELRNCAGTQFDPQLVERLVSIVESPEATAAKPQEEISRAAAISIGTEIERLSDAIDLGDLESIRTITSRLMHTAQTHDLPELTEHARELEREVLHKQDPLKLLQMVTQLSELCRSAQNTHLHASRNNAS